MPAPGHITAYVRVPYRVVGLVVGPKGATIKRIQQDTHTYIITPSRDREPVFEVRFDCLVTLFFDVEIFFGQSAADVEEAFDIQGRACKF